MSKNSLKQVVYPDTTTNSNIQPISKGGTGAITREQALVNLGAIDISLLGAPNGIAKADAVGKVGGGIIPPGAVDQDTVSLDGPSSLLVNSDAIYTITDYDYAKTYAISVTNGTLSRENDKLFIKAPPAVGVLTIMVNDVEHTVNIVVPEIIIAVPTITVPADGATNISITPVLTASAFTTESGTDTHAMTDWEIRSDSVGPGEVVWTSYDDAVNKTSISVTGLNNLTVYYARCRYKGTEDGWTEWSPHSRFTTTALQTVGAGKWVASASSSDGQRIVVAKYDGYLYTSTDGGATWIERRGAGARPWTALASSANGLCLAATTLNGYIYTSIDGGVTWVEQTTSNMQNWSDLASSIDGNTLVAVEYDGYIHVSIDAGASWMPSISAMMRPWQAATVSGDGSKIVAAESGGYIYVSVNGGGTWAAKVAAGARSWRRIAMTPDGTRIFAIDVNGYIYVSTDGGEAWTAITVAGTRKWQDIACSSNGLRVVAVVDGGYVYTSNDGGVTWVERVAPTAVKWHDVSSSSDGLKLVAVVNDGYVYTSINAAAAWTSR